MRFLLLFLLSTICHLQADVILKPLGTPAVLFQRGDLGYTVFKIPALVTAQDGTLLAFSEARMGKGTDRDPTHIVLKRSLDHGTSWSPLSVVYQEGDKTAGNITPVLDTNTGIIWLLFTVNNREVFVTSTSDAGKTWLPPRNITSQIRNPLQKSFFGTGPGHGIQLTQEKYRGRLLVTAYAAQQAGPDITKGSKSFAIFSDDHGGHWQEGKPTETEVPGGPDGGECMAMELADGRLYMTIRNDIASGGRGYALSEDGGATWSKVHREPGLPEPVCEASVLRFPMPGHPDAYLYSAPSLTAKNRKDKSARQKLSLWSSANGATGWTLKSLVYPEAADYSDLTVAQPGVLGILFDADKSNMDRTLFVKYSVTFAGKNAAK